MGQRFRSRPRPIPHLPAALFRFTPIRAGLKFAFHASRQKELKYNPIPEGGEIGHSKRLAARKA
jgi:hypothetical protein